MFLDLYNLGGFSLRSCAVTPEETHFARQADKVTRE